MKEIQPKLSNNLKSWETFYSSEINNQPILYRIIEDMASTLSVIWLVEGGRTDQAFMTMERCHSTDKTLDMR